MFINSGPYYLQHLLDRFRVHYNEDRPHPGIGDLTPAERFSPTPARTLPDGELEVPTYPRGAIIRTVWPIGVVTYDRRNIGLGKRWAGCKVRIVPAGKLIHVYYGKILLRSVTFVPGRCYHGPGRARKEGTPKS